MDCIIWDFNGTLLDDVDTSIATVNDSLKKYGLPLTDKEEYRRNITMPIIRNISRKHAPTNS